MSLKRFVFRLTSFFHSIRGTIDFPGQNIIEQDLYDSNEELRHTTVHIRLNSCENNQTTKAKLIDPHVFLIKYDSSRYGYISRDQIQFENDPLMDGMILSVRLNDPTVTKTNLTYLSRGLWWTPRYEVIVINDQGRISFDLFRSFLCSSCYTSSISRY